MATYYRCVACDAGWRGSRISCCRGGYDAYDARRTLYLNGYSVRVPVQLSPACCILRHLSASPQTGCVQRSRHPPHPLAPTCYAPYTIVLQHMVALRGRRACCATSAYRSSFKRLTNHRDEPRPVGSGDERIRDGRRALFCRRRTSEGRKKRENTAHEQDAPAKHCSAPAKRAVAPSARSTHGMTRNTTAEGRTRCQAWAYSSAPLGSTPRLLART